MRVSAEDVRSFTNCTVAYSITDDVLIIVLELCSSALEMEVFKIMVKFLYAVVRTAKI